MTKSRETRIASITTATAHQPSAGTDLNVSASAAAAEGLDGSGSGSGGASEKTDFIFEGRRLTRLVWRTRPRNLVSDCCRFLAVESRQLTYRRAVSQTRSLLYELADLTICLLWFLFEPPVAAHRPDPRMVGRRPMR